MYMSEESFLDFFDQSVVLEHFFAQLFHSQVYLEKGYHSLSRSIAIRECVRFNQTLVSQLVTNPVMKACASLPKSIAHTSGDLLESGELEHVIEFM